MKKQKRELVVTLRCLGCKTIKEMKRSEIPREGKVRCEKCSKLMEERSVELKS